MRSASSSGGALKREVLGHPVGLYVLVSTEVWERFSYYGMRALLILYLTKVIFSREMWQARPRPPRCVPWSSRGRALEGGQLYFRPPPGRPRNMRCVRLCPLQDVAGIGFVTGLYGEPDDSLTDEERSKQAPIARPPLSLLSSGRLSLFKPRCSGLALAPAVSGNRSHTAAAALTAMPLPRALFLAPHR